MLGVITGVSDVVQYHSSSRSKPSTKRCIKYHGPKGERATTFQGDYIIELGSTEPVVALFVGTLVKAYEGRRGVSGSASCRWYINDDTSEMIDFHKKYMLSVYLRANYVLSFA
ncbi:hypothetical protein VPH35_114149 [Triticum aestivum]